MIIQVLWPVAVLAQLSDAKSLLRIVVLIFGEHNFEDHVHSVKVGSDLHLISGQWFSRSAYRGALRYAPFCAAEASRLHGPFFFKIVVRSASD